jgi:hypothetical protein
MNERLPHRLRRPRPLTVPPMLPAGTRAPIGPDALAAAYTAHKGHEHEGRAGYGCPTCRHYLEALVTARAAEHEHP